MDKDIEELARKIAKKAPYLPIHAEWNIARMIIEEEGYVKAPKNELVPLSKPALIEFLDELYHDPEYLADEIMKKFGSSGKRYFHIDDNSNLHEAICYDLKVHDCEVVNKIIDMCKKEFSTAEVSEERLIDIINDHVSTMYADLVPEYEVLNCSQAELAKAIKAELDGK